MASTRRRQSFGLARALALTFFGLLVVLRIWDPLFLEVVRFRVFDMYQFWRPRPPVDEQVVIVDLDEASLLEIGQWPWPRTVVAELVRRISDAGATVIGFDIFFLEPDRLSPSVYAETLKAASPEIRAALGALPSNDAALARVLMDSPVVLAQAGGRVKPRPEEAPLPEASVVLIGADPVPFLRSFPSVLRNIPELERAAKGLGIVSLEPGVDGIVRRIPGMIAVDNKVLPTLSLEMLLVAGGGGAFRVRSTEVGVESISVGDRVIPTDENGRIWVNYSQYDPQRYVSAAAVLRGRLPRETLAGKPVLIGTSATGLLDIKSTPLAQQVPGVEVHAQLLENILAGSYLSRPSYAIGAEVLLTILVGLLAIGLVPVLGAGYTLLLFVVTSFGLAAGSWFLYVRQGILLDVGFPLLSSSAVFALLVFVNYFREQSQRRQVSAAFSQYLSPELVSQLARNPDRLVLGGETKSMSFLFCDVRGFTTISESYKKNPEGLTRLVNRLLTPMSRDVLERKGTIDKYMGDAIMAFWNAPLSDEQHAQHACEAALAMLASLKRLNEERRAEALSSEREPDTLMVGIGINTGECVVGNFGSEQRFDYTVLGDAVNLASRLEGQTKVYGVPIVVGSATAEALAGTLPVLELDQIRVKGKKLPERIFALIGDESVRRDPDFAGLAEGFRELHQRYRCTDWDAAEAALETCRELGARFGLEELCAVFEGRVRTYRSEPPPAGWDGVFEAQAK